MNKISPREKELKVKEYIKFEDDGETSSYYLNTVWKITSSNWNHHPCRDPEFLYQIVDVKDKRRSFYFEKGSPLYNKAVVVNNPFIR